jgi:hypothetical protein
MTTLGPLLALERALGATTAISALFGVAMKSAQGAVMGLNAVIAANPIGAIAVALTAIIALLYVFSDDIKVTEDGVVSLGDVFVATFEIIGESISGAVALFQEAWKFAVATVGTLFAAFGTTASEVLGGLLQIAKSVVNAFIGFWVLAFRTVQLAWDNFPGLMDVIFTAVVNLGATAAEALFNAWQAPLRGIATALSFINEEAAAGLSGFLDNVTIRVPRREAGAAGRQFVEDFSSSARDALTKDYVGDSIAEVMKRARANAMAQEKSGALNPGGAATPLRKDGSAAGNKSMSQSQDEARLALQQFLNEVDREIKLLGMANREREKAQMLYQLEDELKRGLTTTERELASAKIDALQAARDKSTIDEEMSAIERENKLLSLNRNERELRAAIMQLEERIGRALNEGEQGRVEALVDQNTLLREQRQLLDDLRGPMEEVALRHRAINDLMDQGKLTVREYETAMRDLNLQALQAFQPTNFSESFVQQWMIMQTVASEALTNIGGQVAQIFGPGGTLVKGIGDAVAQAIVFGDSFSEAIGNVARQILTQLISALVQIGLNMLLQATIGKALMASSVAASVAAATATAAAWAPAAALASLATLGTNAAPAAAALVGTTALSKGLAVLSAIVPGFEEGGWTGGVGRSTIAGVVHGQEFVAHAEATRRWRPELEAMNRGDYRPSSGVNVSIANYAPGVQHEVVERSDGEIEIIARRVVQREAAGVVAADLAQPNSKTRKALEANTTARARRS